MRIRTLAVAVVTVVTPSPAVVMANGPGIPKTAVAFELLGRYATGLPGNSAEIAAVLGHRLYVTNADDGSLDIVDISDPTSPALERRVDLSPFGSEVTSVAATGFLVAVTVKADPATDPGTVVVLDPTGDHVGSVEVGAGPDSLVWTPDGKRIAVANEGEPNSYGQPDSVDPEGSVSVIRGVPSAWLPTKRRLLREDTVDFRDFNAGRKHRRELPDGVRIFGPGATVAQDLEREALAIDAADHQIAWVTLQENNALAKIHLPSRKVLAILALGTKDHSQAGNGLDASDRDDAIAIQPWPVRGMYQPDNVASFEVQGETYLVTANEGDARDYAGFGEEERAADVPDTTAIPPAAEDAQLGRLNVTTASPAMPSDQTTLYAFGARSFSIWSAESGALVWDSGDQVEQRTARVLTANFNSDNTANNFDNRSDNKGPEPEAVTIGQLGRRTYAFLGLERIGGVLVWDVTDPAAPTFVQYLLTRDFSGDDVARTAVPRASRSCHGARATSRCSPCRTR